MDELFLRLYVAGDSTSSQCARRNLALLEQSALPAHAKVEVIDVLADPQLAEDAKVLATPTLSYDHPSGSRRIVGDLGDTQKVLDFLGLNQRGAVE